MKTGIFAASVLTAITGAACAAADETKQVLVDTKFVTVDDTFNRDIGISWGSLNSQTHIFDTQQILPGFSISGFVGAEYVNFGTGDYLVGGSADLAQGFALGNGVAAVGVGIQGAAAGGFGEQAWANPFAAYEWGNNRITVGNIRLSFDHIIRGFERTGSINYVLDGQRSLGARFDTTIGQTALSVSANEDGLASVGVALRVTPRIVGYGGIVMDIDTNTTLAAAGLSASLDNTGIRAQIAADNFGNSRLEGEISRAFSDSFSASAYGAFDLSGGAANPVIAIRAAKTLVETSAGETVLIGGIERSGGNTVFNLGVSFLFDNQRRREKTELLVFVTPQIVRGTE